MKTGISVRVERAVGVGESQRAATSEEGRAPALPRRLAEFTRAATAWTIRGRPAVNRILRHPAKWRPRRVELLIALKADLLYPEFNRTARRL